MERNKIHRLSFKIGTVDIQVKQIQTDVMDYGDSLCGSVKVCVGVYDSSVQYIHCFLWFLNAYVSHIVTCGFV